MPIVAVRQVASTFAAPADGFSRHGTRPNACNAANVNDRPDRVRQQHADPAAFRRLARPARGQYRTAPKISRR